MENSRNQPFFTMIRLVAATCSVVSNCNVLELLLATRPPVLLMFLLLLSRQVVSWSSRSEDDFPLSIPHLVSCWGVAITIYHTVIVNGRIQYKNIDCIRQKNHSITLLTNFEITNKYNNVRDYSTRSFYTGLWSVRYSPSLLLLTLGSILVEMFI